MNMKTQVSKLPPPLSTVGNNIHYDLPVVHTATKQESLFWTFIQNPGVHFFWPVAATAAGHQHWCLFILGLHNFSNNNMTVVDHISYSLLNTIPSVV